jgi:RNA polymerase sigma-70 factor (ECF subfamily)
LEIANLTQKELAEKTAISLSGAKSRVQRGRKILKELLLQCCQLELNPAGSLVDFQSASDCKACQSDANSC